MAENRDDERFAHILSDPKFQRIKLKEQKTKVDKRFKSLIASSKSKQQTCLIDKRGRPLTSASVGGLSRFYDLSDSEEEENSGEEAILCKEKKEKTLHKKKDKEEKQEKANQGKGEKKDKAIQKKIPDDVEEDDEQTDEEEGMELDAEEEEDEDESEDEDEEHSEEEDEDDDDDDSEEDEEDKSSSKRNKKRKDGITPDYSRGIGNISSSSDEEADDDDQDGEEEVEDSSTKGPVATVHPWAEMIEKEVQIVEESTRRLAICNMNWDYVTAQDLMMLCNSFKPQHGIVLSVTIYPTEFGIERMREENQKGPKEITEVKESTAESTTENARKTEAEEEESTTEGTAEKKSKKVTKEKKSARKKDETNSEKVRQYELNRLRYFVAVVECDSVETADQIYTNCDGMEFEKSGSKLDFRYIPDGETFDYEPRSVATSLPASGTYKPPHFVDTALSKTDVKLSWDRTSHRRLAVTQMDFRKVKNIDDLEDNFQEYIAPYMSDEDEEAGEDPYPNLDWSYVPGELPAKKDVQEMKSSLLTLKEEEKAEEDEAEEEEEEKEESDENQVHMEFTWDLGLKDSLADAAKQKKKEVENANLTPWEQYQKSKKEKKRQKEREKRKKAKVTQQQESDKLKENSAELDSFFVSDDSSNEEEEKSKRQKESLKKRAKRRKREAEEQHLEVDQAVLADPRFADLAKKDFALDPSAPEFRKRRRKF